MKFELSDQNEMIRDVARTFTETEVKPLAAEVDKESRFPVETVEKLKKYGFLGVPFSQEIGGSGADELAYAIVVEELSRACATTGVIVSAHTSLGGWPIEKYGTPEQKEKYLRPLASGEKLGAFGLTEANAGTDAAGQQTTAILDGDEYILNGSKLFITNGGYADIYIIFAMTDKSQGTRGISTFIVEADTPGFEIGKVEDKLGIRGSSTTELVFTNCRIPKENLLGREGRGFGIAMSTLDGGRIGIAAQALGIAAGALDEAIQYVQEREQFGRPIGKFQGIQWKIAEMYTKVDSARLLVYRAAYNKANGLPYSKEAAMAKLYAAEVAMDVTTKAVQLFGGYGYTTDYPVERMMRDAKITEIYEGTSEVQRMVIAANVIR